MRQDRQPEEVEADSRPHKEEEKEEEEIVADSSQEGYNADEESDWSMC
jgi:hypothetical protein